MNFSLNAHTSIRAAELAVLALAFLIVGVRSGSYSSGDSANSRMATVYALAHEGTWRIDRPADQAPNPFEPGTVDKVMIEGRLLSSKPPLMPALMTAEYIVLKALTGLTLENDEDRALLIRVLTLSFVALPYIVLLIAFHAVLAAHEVDPPARLGLLFCMAFSTQVFGFAATFNNHVPAACFLFIAVALALDILRYSAPAGAPRLLAFGFFGGLAIAFDMPTGVFVALAALALLRAAPRRTLIWAALGAALPLGAHLALTFHTTGSLLPVQLSAENYLFESSYWRNPRGVDALHEPKAIYLFHMLLGRDGLLSLFPILALGVAAGGWALVHAGLSRRAAHVAGIVALACFTTYYLFATNNYGGQAYGFRWYIAASPILLLMAATPFQSLMRTRSGRILLVVLVAVSTVSAVQCSLSPWQSDTEWTVYLFGPTI